MIRTAAMAMLIQVLVVVPSCATTHQEDIAVTDLIAAARTGTIAEVKRELSRGAYVDCVDDEFNTPLMHSVVRNENASAKLLVARGADVRAKNRRNETAFSVACMMGNEEMARLLLDKGASPEIIDVYGSHPLHHAVRNGHAGIVTILLPRVRNINVRDREGNTALRIALRLNRREMVRLLTGAGGTADR